MGACGVAHVRARFILLWRLLRGCRFVTNRATVLPSRRDMVYLGGFSRRWPSLPACLLAGPRGDESRRLLDRMRALFISSRREPILRQLTNRLRFLSVGSIRPSTRGTSNRSCAQWIGARRWPTQGARSEGACRRHWRAKCPITAELLRLFSRNASAFTRKSAFRASSGGSPRRNFAPSGSAVASG